MGVDSGLPDFRGSQGFWRAYPLYEKLGLNFAEMANPHWFLRDPSFAWGFYGHRLNLYRDVRPHSGFEILKKWADAVSGNVFVYTSNVDGQFQKAGFSPDRVLECHGAIERFQCLRRCGIGLFPAGEARVEVDFETMRAKEPLPCCPACGGTARPNILMFGDYDFDFSATDDQYEAYRRWLRSVADEGVVVVECGAGTAIPTVRHHCETLVRETGGTLIRINVRDFQTPPGGIGLALGASEALQAIDDRMKRA